MLSAPGESIVENTDALERYVAEVRAGQFPDAEHSYGMKPEEEAALAKLLAERKR